MYGTVKIAFNGTQVQAEKFVEENASKFPKNISYGQSGHLRRNEEDGFDLYFNFRSVAERLAIQGELKRLGFPCQAQIVTQWDRRIKKIRSLAMKKPIRYC